MERRKKLLISLNICLSLVCLVHISIILHDDLVFHEPSLRTYDVNLKDLDFPIIFKVCVNEIEDGYLRYQKFGYGDVIEFFRGKSMFNESLLGWHGHMENGSTLMSSRGTQTYVFLHNILII